MEQVARNEEGKVDDKMRDRNALEEIMNRETRQNYSSDGLQTRDSTATGTKVKRKSRSARRRLNAMMSNASIHFSDTDSEGELTIINPHVRNSNVGNCVAMRHENPAISVTLENAKGEMSGIADPDCLSMSNRLDHQRSRRSSFADNLTDVDEIYTSEPENDDKSEARKKSLTVAKSAYQADTDLEDLSNDEEDIRAVIYVEPRSDLLCDINGEVITAKEGDGPFSVEVRKQMSLDVVTPGEIIQNMSNTSNPESAPNTDCEDVDASDEEYVPEASCSQRDLLEDLDILAASQIVMKNVDKMGNTLNVKDLLEDNTGDCYTDVEDIE